MRSDFSLNYLSVNLGGGEDVFPHDAAVHSYGAIGEGSLFLEHQDSCGGDHGYNIFTKLKTFTEQVAARLLYAN